ncbi:class F sortase [Streptomyces sp. NBC_00859]|uniref:class F sortase n=1 Tax=Streptomyces sp. NBC_00859 TaxID=2903682 RepID=UPI003865B9D0|nr:class F sortase [Streptomyces sp. NBC_00859]
MRQMRGMQRMGFAHRRRRTVLVLVVSALLVAGGVLLGTGIARQQPAPPRAVDKGGPSATTPAAPARSQAGRQPPPASAPPGQGDSGAAHAVSALPASDPVRLTIPALKVSSTLERLGLGKDHAMETPRDPSRAGWYTPGTAPGSVGPAVIAGHVTWNGARGVFFRLSDLGPGDRIQVARRDGRTAEFTVDRVAVYPKDAFPTVEVYRNIGNAGLRLITCGGAYSQAQHHYADNVVVYASLTGHT